MTKHPEWATKHKRKGTELRCLNGKYYLYEVSSKWNPEKKRAQKISGKLLGRITEEHGFVESDKDKLRKREITFSKLTVKEYGISAFINSHLGNYVNLLHKHFPKHADIILVLAYCRLIHKSPLKNAEFHYMHSFLSEISPNLSLSSKNLTALMREIGVQREQILAFFKEFTLAKDNIIFDGTDMFCNSKNMSVSKFSKSKRGTFDYVANIMFAFSTDLQLPVYYRLLPGSIKDIKAFKYCLEESQIQDVVVIADKGFYSKANLLTLKNEQLSYIIPLRRNNTLIDCNIIKESNRNKMRYFIFEGRVIWFYTAKKGNDNLTIYIDDELKTEEIKDYLLRTKSLPEKYNMEQFHEKQYTFGTIALLNNLEKTEEQVFIDYKSRMQIETMIDTLKNVLDADNSYMQNEHSLEAWMFINFIALHWYYKIINVLKSSNLNNKYSPSDFLMFLTEVRKIKINGTWHLSEITKKNADLLKIAGIHIT